MVLAQVHREDGAFRADSRVAYVTPSQARKQQCPEPVISLGSRAQRAGTPSAESWYRPGDRGLVTRIGLRAG